MIQTALQPDRIVKWTFSLSLVLHLLVIFIFDNADLLRSRLPETAAYYVDIVSLPTLEPASSGSEAAAPAPPLPGTPALQPPAPLKPAMSLPVKPLPSAPKTSVPSAENQNEQEAREFSERMSRLERGSEARHQADALASLQRRVTAKQGSGAAATAGITTGSDYGAYIQSRLKDALSTTIAFQSQKPEVAVHLYLDRAGKLVKYVMVRPSSDKLFNNSVIRAIEKAKADFPPVPSGREFDKLYVFSPQEGIK